MREIYYNGVIPYGETREVEAMAVEDGRLPVGTLLIWRLCSDVVYHNLDGHFVVLGFNDSHMHLLNYGHTLKLVDLNGGNLVPGSDVLRPFPFYFKGKACTGYMGSRGGAGITITFRMRNVFPTGTIWTGCPLEHPFW